MRWPTGICCVFVGSAASGTGPGFYRINKRRIIGPKKLGCGAPHYGYGNGCRTAPEMMSIKGLANQCGTSHLRMLDEVPVCWTGKIAWAIPVITKQYPEQDGKKRHHHGLICFLIGDKY